MMFRILWKLNYMYVLLDSSGVPGLKLEIKIKTATILTPYLARK